MKDNSVIITGGKRTGTRLIAAICERLGVYFGEKEDMNEKYEHNIIAEFMSNRDIDLVEKVFSGNRRWGLKHPVLSEKIDEIYKKFPQAKVIYMTRDFKMPDDKKELTYYWGVDLKDKNYEKFLKKRFEKKQKTRFAKFNEIKPADLPVLYIHYDDFVFDPIEGTKKIAEYLYSALCCGACRLFCYSAYFPVMY